MNDSTRTLGLVDLVADANCEVYKVIDMDCEATPPEIFILKCIKVHTKLASVKDRAEYHRRQTAKTEPKYRALMTLDHQNVVKYLDYGRNKSDKTFGILCWYSLQEFMEGEASAASIE